MENIELLRKKSDMLAGAVEEFIASDNGGKFLREKEKEEVSSKQDDTYLDAWMSQVEFYPYQFIALLGMGKGTGINKILDAMQEESVLLIYEPYKEKVYDILTDTEFQKVLQDKRVQIFVEGMNTDEFAFTYGGAMTDIYKNHTCFWYHPDYFQVGNGVLDRFKELVREGMEFHQVQNNTRGLFYKDYYQNVVHGVWNMMEIKAVKELEKVIPKDTFVVLVAAGPSLEQAVDVLKEKRDKILIVAVYRVVDYLLEHDIVPDFITTMDYHQKIVHVKSEEISKIPMILSETSSPEVWEHHRGVKIVAGYESYCCTILNNCGISTICIPEQTSVAAWQLFIMAELGIERVALVGQDLSYQGKNSHIGGVQEDIYNNGEMVEGMDGKMIPSRGDWVIHLQVIENIIQCHSKTIVYDTKSAGAKIKYTVPEKLSVLIDKYGNHNVAGIRERVENLPFLITEDVREKYVKELEKSRENVELMLKKAKRLIFLAGEICEGRKEQPLEKKNVAEEISEINVWMEKQKEMELINLYVEAETMELADKIFKYSDDEDEDERNTYIYIKEYYKYIMIALQQVKEEMDKNIR